MENDGNKSWCGGDIGRGFGDNTRGGSGNGWIGTGGIGMKNQMGFLGHDSESVAHVKPYLII